MKETSIAVRLGLDIPYFHFHCYACSVMTSSLQANNINEMEGTSSSVAFDAAPQASLQDMMSGVESSVPVYDETARCATSFRILRQMVAAWLRDVSVYQNVFADYQIVHFYRWLHDPNSLMYDPALHRILRNLMQKLFLHLIAEFKRLGSVIVHANFNKIILCTRKKRLVDAISYVQYVVNSIRGKELFHSIDISFNQCWEYLIWLDPSNHGGVKGKLPKEIQNTRENHEENRVANGDEEQSDMTTEEEGPVIEMTWNLAEYLPKWCDCQTSFNNVIASYINTIYEKLQEETDRYSPGNTPMKRKAASQASQPQAPQGANKSCEEFAQELVAGQLAQKLYFLTQRIQKKGSAHREEEEAEQSMLLATTSHQIPALEFVKSVTKVLSLDSTVTQEVRV